MCNMILLSKAFNRLDTLGRFSTISYKGENFCDFLFAFLCIPFWKEVYSKIKEFAPCGSKFFPVKEEHFSEMDKNNFDRVASPKVYLFSFNQ